MRADIQPSATFPDCEVPDQIGRKRRLSELQGDNSMIVLRGPLAKLAGHPDQWSKARLKLVAPRDDRPTHAHRTGEISRFRTIQRVEIPCRCTAMRQVRTEPTADHFLLVPEVLDARVRQSIPVPAPARIAGIHVEPHRVNLQISLRIFF
jgi:hypothetical protein